MSSDILKNSNQRLNNLTRILGLESIRRGLKTEDDIARRDGLAYHNLLHGGQSSPPSEDDEMGHIVLGDMVTNVLPPTPSKGMGALAKVAIAAGLLGTGVGSSVGIPLLIDVLKPVEKLPVVIPGTPGEIRDWELGKPVVE
jgi:hypothetical protein